MENERLQAGAMRHALAAVGLLLTLALSLLAGCTVKPESEWPVQTIVATPEAVPYLNCCDFAGYKHMDGTLVRREIVPAAELPGRLRQGGVAVVLVTDFALLDQLRREGRLAPPPWVFEMERNDLAVIAPPGSTVKLNKLEDLGTAHIQPIGVVESNLNPIGRITARLISDNNELRMALDTCQEQQRSERAVYLGVREGRLPLGIVTATMARQRPGEVRELLAVNPRPDLPSYLAGAVPAAPPDPVGARRLWNYIEKGIRFEECALIPHRPVK